MMKREQVKQAVREAVYEAMEQREPKTDIHVKVEGTPGVESAKVAFVGAGMKVKGMSPSERIEALENALEIRKEMHEETSTSLREAIYRRDDMDLRLREALSQVTAGEERYQAAMVEIRRIGDELVESERGHAKTRQHLQQSQRSSQRLRQQRDVWKETAHGIAADMAAQG